MISLQVELFVLLYDFKVFCPKSSGSMYLGRISWWQGCVAKDFVADRSRERVIQKESKSRHHLKNMVPMNDFF